jgi:hypothetical protein
MNKGLILLLSVLFSGSVIMMAGCAPKQESTETAAPAVEEAVPAEGEAVPAVEGEAPAEAAPAE